LWLGNLLTGVNAVKGDCEMHKRFCLLHAPERHQSRVSVHVRTNANWVSGGDHPFVMPLGDALWRMVRVETCGGTGSSRHARKGSYK